MVGTQRCAGSSLWAGATPFLQTTVISPLRTFCLLLIGTGLLLALVLGAAGCGGGSGGLSPGLAAAPLPEFNEQGIYSPYYVTGEMATPRYMHVALRLKNSLVFVHGGSDENGFSSIDTAEVFDQSSLQKDEVEPESKVGTWFDTNFEGDPIVASFGRIFHTVTELPDNTVIAIGGVANLNLSDAVGVAEIFDPLTREFEKVEEEMVNSRFRHQATLLDDGRIMITGGQISSVFTESQTANVVGGGQAGQVQIQVQRVIFPSTKKNEVYSITEQIFLPLTLPDSTREADLTPSRGRSGHVTARFAGPDNRLETGDDLYLLAGGYQTLSGENAPQTKFPGINGNNASPLLKMEVYDPVIGVFTEVPTVRMLAPRINHPQATNLGLHNEFTPDGVLGLGNTILVTHGDDDEPNRDSWPESAIYVATFSGFGPAQGLTFFRQESPFNEHVQGLEAFVALGGVWEVSLLPDLFACPPPPGRTTTNIVPLPRRLQSSSGRGDVQTWVYTGGGVHLWFCPPVQIIYPAGTIAAGCLFDPFYSVTAVIDFDSSARDLRPGRRDARNPVGVIGTWLAMDGVIPTDSLEGFGDTSFTNWPQIRGGTRYWTQLVPIAGEDGIDDTLDDRVLLCGGGRNVFAPGGDPTFPSSELVLLPGTGSDRRNR